MLLYLGAVTGPRFQEEVFEQRAEGRQGPRPAKSLMDRMASEKPCGPGRCRGWGGSEATRSKGPGRPAAWGQQPGLWVSLQKTEQPWKVQGRGRRGLDLGFKRCVGVRQLGRVLQEVGACEVVLAGQGMVAWVPGAQSALSTARVTAACCLNVFVTPQRFLHNHSQTGSCTEWQTCELPGMCVTS